MNLNLVTAPTVEPLTAAEAKARLNIGDEVSDEVMGVFITAARQMLDGSRSWLGIAINTQTWDLVCDRFPDVDPYLLEQLPGIVIPLPPLQSVTSITYLDTDSVQQIFPAASYVVLPGEPSRIVLASGAAWPSASWVRGSVKVRFVAGFGDNGSDVPETIRMAIALQANFLRTLSQQNLRSETVDGVGAVGPLSSSVGNVIDAAAQALLKGYRVWT